MSLSLITGRAGAGKSQLVHRALVESCSASGTAVLALPTHAEVARARRELSHDVPLGLLITTLDGWISTLWAEYGDGRRPVSRVQRYLLVRRAMREVPGKLTEGGSPGVTRLLMQLAQRTAGALTLTPGSSIDTDIVRILGLYRELLEREGCIEHNAAAVALATQSPKLPGAVAIHRFSDLSWQQEQFVGGLSARNEVTVALTYEPGFPATEALDPLVSRLSAGAEISHLEVPKRASELERLEANLFRRQGTGSPMGEVALVSSPGPEAEICSVAAEVAQMVQSGVPPAGIAVAFRDVAARYRAVDAALAERGIAADFEFSMPVGDTPLGQAVMGLMRASAMRVEPHAGFVGSLLRGPYTRCTESRAHETEAEWRRRRVEGVHSMLQGAASHDSVARAALRMLNAAGGVRFMPTARVLVVEMLASATAQDIRWDMDVRIDSAAAAEIVALIDSLDDIGSDNAGPAEMLDLLADAVITLRASERDDAVLVAEAPKLKGRTFEAVVLGGMSASEFSSEKREPLVADVLKRLGMPAGTEERLSERALFYAIVTTARRRLVLVRQGLNVAGEPARASSFFEEVLDHYRSMDDAQQGGEGPDALYALRNMPPEDAVPTFTEGRRVDRRAAREGRFEIPRAKRGLLRDPGALQTADAAVPVTQLEKYLECPYKWYFQYVLNPKPLDGSFGALERGSLAHGLLAEFYTCMRQAGLDRVRPGNLETALRIYGEVALATSEAHRWKVRGVSEQWAFDSTLAECRKIIEQDQGLFAGFVPYGEEWSFGGEGEDGFTLGGVRLRGRIDRIDCGRDGCIVTDYKASGIVGYQSFLKENKLQLVVYSQAVSAILGKPVVGGVYRSIRNLEVRGFWCVETAEADEALSKKDLVSGEQFGELVAATEAAVERAAHGMRAGSIERTPSQDSCRYCPAAAWCEEAAR